MPTECERSDTSPDQQESQQQLQQQPPPPPSDIQQKDLTEKMEGKEINGEMSTSQTSTTSSNGHNGSSSSSTSSTGGGKKTPIISPDPTAYVAKARVTRPTPPPPSYNPMQFVQIKPCNLYQTAQQQLKKAEEVKKIKEIKKEEPEDWQNNLDNWKSSRRKRVEHIIDRVVEVKKLELEEHDRSRRKSKTFSEMIEERGERGVRAGRAKLVSLAVYNEDESNDLSDLGIGTSSASGKSSISEDYDNNSVLSDNVELDRAILENNHKQHCTTREYISSPGYDTSSSTAPGSSPDPCEYTYEGAIQDYKQRVSRATTSGVAAYKLNSNNKNLMVSGTKSKESTPERLNNGSPDTYPTRRGNKIEDRLIGFEVTSPSDNQEGLEKVKVDVPKIDISKRKEMFENPSASTEPKSMGGNGGVPKVTLRDRFKLDATNAVNSGAQESAKKEVKRVSGDITSIRDRLQSLEQQQNLVNSTNAAGKSSTAKLVDIPVPPLKERLSSLQNAVTKEEVKKTPVVLVDARQLEIMKNEEEVAQQRMKQLGEPIAMPAVQGTEPAAVLELSIREETDVDRDDSGIHTSDDIESEERIADQLQKEQEEQLNAAIAALAMEEKQLEEAANAVNQIEAEFAELSSATAPLPDSNEPPCEMEFSINEALELALEAIDKETRTAQNEEDDADDDDDNNDDDETNKIDTKAVIKKTIEMQIKTDKTNERKSKLQTKVNVDDILEEELAELAEQQEEVNEKKISQEPIYENIMPAAALELEAEAVIIIPNTNINTHNNNKNNNYNNKISKATNSNNLVELTNAFANIPITAANAAAAAAAAITTTTSSTITTTPKNETTLITKAKATATPVAMPSVGGQLHHHQQHQKFEPKHHHIPSNEEPEPYYQVPKSSEPYYDAPKHLRPIPVYENIEVFYNGLENSTLSTTSTGGAFRMEPPKEKPPPPPTESPPPFDDAASSVDNADTWSSDNTYETISTHQSQNGLAGEHPSPPIKRMNSTKRIKKELRNKRSSFLGIEGSLDDDDTYLELTVAPPPDMAQLLQEERRLEKQLYMKAGLCDSSDTGESRDSGVSENHSRQSSEHYTNSSEENDSHIESPHSLKQTEVIYQNEALLTAAQTPLLQTVKGNSAESWTESATAAAAATKSLTEATATANAKMLSIEEKIREQEEVLRVERELLQLEQEELKRQRENLMLRENMARRELQHGAKMLMSANRHSLQDLNGGTTGMSANGNGAYPAAVSHPLAHHPSQPQEIYANVPNLQPQYYQVETDYRKSMSDLNEFSKRLMLPPTPPTKPMRAMHVTTNGHEEFAARQRQSLNAQGYGGSLVKIATPTAAPRTPIYSNFHHQSVQNLANIPTAVGVGVGVGLGVGVANVTSVVTNGHTHHGNMTRNTLHALSATPKPKYTDGWVQVQNRKSYDSNLANDPAWLSAYQQKRKSMPDAYHAYNNHWLVQEAEQRRMTEQQRRSISTGNTPVHQQNGSAAGVAKVLNTGAKCSTVNGNGKPLPDSIIQTLTERVQSKGIGERKRFENYSYSSNTKNNNKNNNNLEKSALHAASYQHQQQQQQQSQPQLPPQTTTTSSHRHPSDLNPPTLPLPTTTNTNTSATQDKVLSVSGKKKCSHCGDELGRGAAMIIESLLLFYHINCFKCCVCHVQLGDGLNGTDVRVRNHKLHCQNCYSSDDGIKFSCV